MALKIRHKIGIGVATGVLVASGVGHFTIGGEGGSNETTSSPLGNPGDADYGRQPNFDIGYAEPAKRLANGANAAGKCVLKRGGFITIQTVPGKSKGEYIYTPHTGSDAGENGECDSGDVIDPKSFNEKKQRDTSAKLAAELTQAGQNGGGQEVNASDFHQVYPVTPAQEHPFASAPGGCGVDPGSKVVRVGVLSTKEAVYTVRDLPASGLGSTACQLNTYFLVGAGR